MAKKHFKVLGNEAAIRRLGLTRSQLERKSWTEMPGEPLLVAYAPDGVQSRHKQVTRVSLRAGHRAN